MKNIGAVLAFCLILSLSACGNGKITESESAVGTALNEALVEEEDGLSKTNMPADEIEIPSETGEIEEAVECMQAETNNDQNVEDEGMQLRIGENTVNVDWEKNASVDALAELVSEEPLTVQMSMYGGFEQVGPLGSSLPRDDVQTTTGAGDIVLYSGNQIVIFYGSNSWAYTRLGKITGMSGDELKEMLGNGDVTIVLSK